MKSEFILFGGATFYVMDIMNDGYYTDQLKKYKKHYKVITTLFVVFSMYLYIKKNPSESKNIVEQVTGLVQHLPMDKSSRTMLEPFLDAGEIKVVTSGEDSNSRSVSGTKKKWVAASQGWKCKGCQQQLDAWFEVDHTKRLADGGSNHVDNLTAMCRNCHGKKTSMEML